MTYYRQNNLLLARGILYGNYCFNALEVIGAKIRREEMINQGIFYRETAPESYFNPVQAPHFPTGFLATHFIIKKGVKASKALRHLREGLTMESLASSLSYPQKI